MRRTKHCPKCGSTNIDFLAFYRPSIWRCLDCGYEGAFILEGNMTPQEMMELYRRRCSVIDRTEEEPCVNFVTDEDNSHIGPTL